MIASARSSITSSQRGAWPSRLVLKIGEGEFIQFRRVHRERWIGLPGDRERWAQKVQSRIGPS